MSESCEESLSVQYSPHEKNSLNQSPVDVTSESMFQTIRPNNDIQIVKPDSAESNLRDRPVNWGRVSTDRFYTMKNSSNNNNSKKSITAINNQLLIIDENNQSSQATSRPPPVQNHKIRSRSFDNAKHLQQNTVNLINAVPITIGSSSGFYTGDLSSIVLRSKSKKTSVDQATKLRKAILLEHKQKKERIETENKNKNEIDQKQEQPDHQIFENKKIANQAQIANSRYRYASDGLLDQHNNISYQSSLERRNKILQQEAERLCQDFEKAHDIKAYDLEKFYSSTDQQGPSTFNFKSSDLSPDQSFNGQQSFNSTTKSRHSSSKNHTIQPPNLFSPNKNEHRKSKIEQYVIEIPSDLPHKAEYLSALGDPNRMLDVHRDATQFNRPKSNIGESSHGLSRDDVLKIKEFVNKNKLNSPSSSLINNRGPLVSSKGSSPRKRKEDTISNNKKTVKPNINECVSDTDSDREEHCKGLHIVEWIPDSGGKGVNGFYMGNEKVQNNLYCFGSSSTDGSDNQIYPLEPVVDLADQGKMSDVSDKESTTFIRQLEVTNNKEKDILEKMMITRQQKQDQQNQIPNQNHQISDSSKVAGRTSKCSNNTSGNSSGTSSNIKPSSSNSNQGTYGSNKTTHREISEKKFIRISRCATSSGQNSGSNDRHTGDTGISSMDYNSNNAQSRKRKDEARDHDQLQYDEGEYPQNVNESSSAKYKKRNSKENLIEESATAKNQESTDITTIESSKDNPETATDMIDKKNPDSDQEKEEDKINDEKADDEKMDDEENMDRQESDSKHSKSRKVSENKSEEEKMEDVDEEKEVKFSVRDKETNSELQPVTLPRELPVSLTKIWALEKGLYIRWCNITYYEHERAISIFRGENPRITIDCSTNPDNPSERFCLGYFGNINRKKVTRIVRMAIAKGVELRKKDDLVVLTSNSLYPVFVQSYFGNIRLGIDSSSVVEMTFGESMVVFDYNQFHNFLMVAKSEGYEALIILSRYLSTSVSFMKGWGAGYRRKKLENCPCWLDITMTEPMQLLKLLIENITKTNSDHFPQQLRRQLEMICQSVDDEEKNKHCRLEYNHRHEYKIASIFNEFTGLLSIKCPE